MFAALINNPGVAAGWEAGRVPGPAGGGLGHQEQHQPGQHRLRKLRGPAVPPPQQLAGAIYCKLLFSYHWRLYCVGAAGAEAEQRHHGRHRPAALQQAEPPAHGVHAAAEVGRHRGHAAAVRSYLAPRCWEPSAEISESSTNQISKYDK